MKNDKQYLITEEELKIIQVQGWNFRRLIKSKQPVKTLDRKEVEKIVNKVLLSKNDVIFNIPKHCVDRIKKQLVSKICKCILPEQKTLNRTEVEKILTKGLKFCLKRNKKDLIVPTYDEEGNVWLINIEGIVSYLLPKICSLIIPKEKIIKALKGTFGHYYKVANKKFYDHVANEILKEE